MKKGSFPTNQPGLNSCPSTYRVWFIGLPNGQYFTSVHLSFTRVTWREGGDKFSSHFHVSYALLMQIFSLPILFLTPLNDPLSCYDPFLSLKVIWALCVTGRTWRGHQIPLRSGGHSCSIYSMDYPDHAPFVISKQFTTNNDPKCPQSASKWPKLEKGHRKVISLDPNGRKGPFQGGSRRPFCSKNMTGALATEWQDLSMCSPLHHWSMPIFHHIDL